MNVPIKHIYHAFIQIMIPHIGLMAQPVVKLFTNLTQYLIGKVAALTNPFTNRVQYIARPTSSRR